MSDIIVLPILKIQDQSDSWHWLTDIKGVHSLGISSVEAAEGIEAWYLDGSEAPDDTLTLLTLERTGDGPGLIAVNAKRIFLCNGATGATIDTIL